VVAARKEYLYHTIENGGGAPIQDYHTEENLQPDFLYSPQYPNHRVVEFYSPMCPHCVHFAPHYIEFARTFSSTNTALGVEFHAVSCLKFREVCQKQKINSYPTIKVFPLGAKEGTVLRYTNLHPMTLIKTLGISVADNNHGDKSKEKSASTTTSTTSTTSSVGSSRAGESESKSATDIVTKEIPAFGVRTSPEMFADASLSFYHIMKTAVFTGQKGDAGSKERKETLFYFLELLHKVLPPLKLHPLLENLLQGTSHKKPDKFYNSMLNSEQNWNSMFEHHQKISNGNNVEWSPACQLHDSPMTCGMWTLFHIITVGVVEYNSGLPIEDLRNYLVVEPMTVADTLRDFIQHFFLCEACSTHFVQEYKNCKYGQCHRLPTPKTKSLKLRKNKSSEEYVKEWKELPLWLLETHNGVNLRLAQERKQEAKLPFSAQDQQSVLWPPVRECPQCWVLGNNHSIASFQEYNHTAMYNYLRLTYWYVWTLMEKKMAVSVFDCCVGYFVLRNFPSSLFAKLTFSY